MAAKHQRIKNEAPTHKYFTTMLNMADDDLDPFQYRLLAHYIRKSGHGGVIDESVRETAKATQMSTTKVQKARDELGAMGYLKINKPSKEQARKGETVHIVVVDRWSENVNRYAKGVLKITQLDTEAVPNLTQEAVSEIPHYASQAVPNLTRSLNNRRTSSSSGAQKSKSKTIDPQLAMAKSLIQSWADALGFFAPMDSKQRIKQAKEMLAWPIPPTSEEIREVTTERLKIPRNGIYEFVFLLDDIREKRALTERDRALVKKKTEDQRTAVEKAEFHIAMMLGSQEVADDSAA